MSDQSANVNLQSGIQSALFNLQSAILAAACLVAAPPLQASGLTAPEPLAKAYDLILDARFDEADQQLTQACGPAPLNAERVGRWMQHTQAPEEPA